MSMIATAASGSKAWLYHYYPSKDRIVEDLVVGFLESVVGVAEDAVGAAGTPEEKLRRLLVDVVLVCSQAPGGSALFDLRDASVRSARASALDVRFMDVLEGAIVDADPRLRHRPAQRAPVLQSTVGILSSQHRWWRDGGSLTVEQWGHLAADMVIGGLGAVLDDDRFDRQRAPTSRGKH